MVLALALITEVRDTEGNQAPRNRIPTKNPDVRALEKIEPIILLDIQARAFLKSESPRGPTPKLMLHPEISP